MSRQPDPEDSAQFAGEVEKVPREFAITAVDEVIRLGESQSGIAHRGAAMRFLFWIYGPAVIATFTIIFLQGFKTWGFHLDDHFLGWLGAAIIGELGIIAGVVYGALFKKRG